MKLSSLQITVSCLKFDNNQTLFNLQCATIRFAGLLTSQNLKSLCFSPFFTPNPFRNEFFKALDFGSNSCCRALDFLQMRRDSFVLG